MELPNHHSMQDLTGRRYGKLTVVEWAGRDKRGIYLWKCLCDCGNYTIVKRSNLRTDKGRSTKSCGCLKQHAPGVGAFNSKLATIRCISTSKKIPFTLTEEQVWILFKGFCFYCGAEPQQTYHAERSTGPLIYNGIDRVNPSDGYVWGNCVSCCGTCNRIKLDHSVEFLFNHLKKMLLYRGVIEDNNVNWGEYMKTRIDDYLSQISGG